MRTCKLYYCSCKYLPKFSDARDYIPLNPSIVSLCVSSLMDGLFVLILYSSSNNKKDALKKIHMRNPLKKPNVQISAQKKINIASKQSSCLVYLLMYVFRYTCHLVLVIHCTRHSYFNRRDISQRDSTNHAARAIARLVQKTRLR